MKIAVGAVYDRAGSANSPPWPRKGGRDINNCPECRLVVELDGQPHYALIADTYEAERTKYLEQLGFKIARFENRLICEALESVLETIRQELCPRRPDGSAEA